MRRRLAVPIAPADSGSSPPVQRLPPVPEGFSSIAHSHVLDDGNQPVLAFGELLRDRGGLVEEDHCLVGGETSRGSREKGGPRGPENPGSSNETVGTTRCHPTVVLEKCGERRVAQLVMPGPIVERRDPSETFDLEQSGNMFQLHQVVGQLIEMEMIHVFVDPFLECRSEGAHSISPNICSTLPGGCDIFQRVVLARSTPGKRPRSWPGWSSSKGSHWME